jgi:hypothetical protein
MPPLLSRGVPSYEKQKHFPGAKDLHPVCRF